MIGNDVVDLGDPESRTSERHPRFDSRVFDVAERALIQAAAHAERTRWLIWAAKESAYKALRKEQPRTVFAPVRFVVTFQSDGTVSVAAGDRRFHVDVVANGEHVHAVARSEGDAPGRVCAAAAIEATETPSVAVRRLAIAALSPIFGLAPGDLAIHRDGRTPTLWLQGRRSAADLSLSHHGRFVAFACALPLHRSFA